MKNETELLTDLGARIKKLRMSKGMTQTQLALNCGFEKSSMSKIESGQVNPSYLILWRVSKGLDAHICDILPSKT